MTGLYDWNPMPHVLDVICPRCSMHAQFEFAQMIQIKLKKDVPYFQSSRAFEYAFVPSSTGSRSHAAIFYPGLHGSLDAMRDLPEGYAPTDWAHSEHLYRSHGTDRGSIRCDQCGAAQTHELKWPADTFYTVEHRGQTLWAFNLESTVSIRDYLESNGRELKDQKWAALLRHLPTVFKKRNYRDALVKKLNKLIHA